jgi:glycosyltransferase involved in cell wall biosynthesis
MKKKLIFLKSTIAAPVSGADISMFERLELLAKLFGWEVNVHATSMAEHAVGIEKVLRKLELSPVFDDQAARYSCRNVPVDLVFGPGLDAYEREAQKRIAAEFARAVKEKRPDLVLANCRDLPALRFIARDCPVPAVFFLTEDEYMRPEAAALTPEGEELAADMRHVRHVIVASEFLRQSLKASWGIEAQVFLNAVNVDYYELAKESPGEYIAMLSPFTHKGIDIVLKLAAAMPDENFLVVGGLGPDYRQRRTEFASCPNLTHWIYQRDVRDVFRQSRLVLVPSLWEEAVSRVVVEALASGTPVIAAESGGIRTAGGDAALYLPVKKLKDGGDPREQDIGPWIAAIRRFADKAYYDEQVSKARERSKWYRKTLCEQLAVMDQFFCRLIG